MGLRFTAIFAPALVLCAGLVTGCGAAPDGEGGKAASSQASSAQTVSAAPPNLLYIMTDEHNFRTLGAYRAQLDDAQAKPWGEVTVDTPNLDYLADNGALFTSFYATSPSCTPSRAAMLTGDYPQTNNIVSNGKTLPRTVPTLADVLQKRGYATGYVGKFHLIGSNKPMWAPEYAYGFEDKRFMFNGGHWKQFRFDENGAPKEGRRPPKRNDGTFATDWLTSRTLDFFDTQKDSGQPFFHVLSLPDPHTPNSVRPPYNKMYDIKDFKVPDTWREIYDDAMPEWWGPEIDSLTKFRDKKTGKTTKGRPVVSSQEQKNTIRRDATQYFGMVNVIDENIGRIIERLKENGQFENTVIIFSSDHGDLLGEHGRDNKGVPYEGSAKIPFIVYYPQKISTPVIVDKAANNTDLMDTALSLMGVEGFDYASTDGRDLTPWLYGQEDADLADMTFVRYRNWAGVFTDRYKLILETRNTVPWLIDLEKNPDETVNYFKDPEYQETIAQLAEALKAYGDRYDDDIVKHPKVKSAIRKILR